MILHHNYPADEIRLIIICLAPISVALGFAFSWNTKHKILWGIAFSLLIGGIMWVGM
jgi:hypothetical protein